MNDKREISLNEINSDAFVRLLKQGDERVFSDLFSFIVPKLCNFLLSNFNLADFDGEEIAADVMIRVNKSVGTFNPRGGAKLSTWIFRIAQNAAIDFIRQQKKLLEKNQQSVNLDDTIEIKIAQKTAKQWFRNKATDASARGNKPSAELARINYALDNLSEQDRSILLMRQNIEYEQIAEAEKTNVVALRTRYSRAFERLRRELEGEKNL